MQDSGDAIRVDMEVPSGAAPGQSLEFTIRCAITDADFQPPPPAASAGTKTAGAKIEDSPGSALERLFQARMQIHPAEDTIKSCVCPHLFRRLLSSFLSQRNFRPRKLIHKCHPTLRVVRQHLVVPSGKVVVTNANKGATSEKQKRFFTLRSFGPHFHGLRHA